MKSSTGEHKPSGVRFRRIVFLLIFGATAVTASAQYFGRNKVQYEKFDYRV